MSCVEIAAVVAVAVAASAAATMVTASEGGNRKDGSERSYAGEKC